MVAEDAMDVVDREREKLAEKYAPRQDVCNAFKSHSLCIMLCEHCWHPYEAHVTR